ncbi:hypothetical protein C7R54_14480 [Achromobacter aloeverae]|uniref:PIN domain-containing protein n=1 Tax=Achromobacter aloeverae TaxID=1750518 RepID=A0A4V1MS05_9BURK|nr:hypothetical protein C7R54_14480 [Achromobacter aloeverae]
MFNRVLDKQFDLSSVQDATGLVASPVQLYELRSTPDETRRTELLQIFNSVTPDLEATALAFDIPGAGFDEANWGDDDRIQAVRNDLEKVKSKLNNWQDALIAGVALKYGYGLVTSDRLLADVAERHGITVRNI